MRTMVWFCSLVQLLLGLQEVPPIGEQKRLLEGYDRASYDIV